MQRAKRPVLASVLAISLLCSVGAPVAHAFEPFDGRPGEFSMIADVFIGRPAMLGATAIGLGLFTVSLPASLIGGNISESAEKLVKRPARSAFIRCLGCTQQQHDQQQLERQTADANR
ncbi:MAG: hypothetical protein CVV10_08785 [Gammaproteobacteria bacterium HGW-Gammaproteobacteria-14]|nr:MAG: hypothetical protein CVV10_08785 [Gammaproteobacteria bacterium HGW-Gammaproteobacteria-14]